VAESADRLVSHARSITAISRRPVESQVPILFVSLDLRVAGGPDLPILSEGVRTNVPIDDAKFVATGPPDKCDDISDTFRRLRSGFLSVCGGATAGSLGRRTLRGSVFLVQHTRLELLAKKNFLWNAVPWRACTERVSIMGEDSV